MKIIFRWLLVITVITTAVFFAKPYLHTTHLFSENEHEEEEENEARFSEARTKYEFDMLKDVRTGKIPEGIFEQELAFARTLPTRGNSSSRVLDQNTYLPAGPNNIGGRTRAIAYDLRYNGTTNRVIIAGCVSGGIMRTTDGGATWTRVSPQNDIHNFTTIAQDPVNRDTWYAGGGEPYGNTAAEVGAVYRSFGIWKSTDNGASWTRIFANGALEAFDHPFDYVYKIAINPVNSNIYIGGVTGVYKSTDAAASFTQVFQVTSSATADNTQTDITISKTGNILVAVNGGSSDLTKRGIWVSSTGDVNTFTRIAGGQTLGVDSVSGWRANSYDIIQAASGSNSALYATRRILATFAPSNDNVAYIFYQNGLSSDAPDLKPEADLFRLDISGSTYTWTNRSANMPDFPTQNLSGSDPLTVQDGYDMEIRVKPDNPNVVFVGGTNLYRSTDGFATTTNTAWIAGYQSNFTYSQIANSHPDIHALAFNPSNASEATCGNDGGIQNTADIMAATVSWNFFPNYQTLQYYNVAIDPGAGRNNFAGGAQDNGVRYRDKTGVLGTAAADSNNHRLLFSADGAYVGISTDNAGTQYLYESIQFGSLRRVRLSTSPTTSGEIRPANLTTSSTDVTDEFGEFVTNLRLISDNTDDLYYINFNRLFRTTSASTVTSTTGWTELTGVGQAVNPSNPTSGRDIGIRGFAYTRGPYTTSHALYFGTTNGKIFRLDDPRNAAPTTVPVNITPTGLSGNVQDIAVNPNNDNEILAVVSNYGVVGIWWTANAKAAVPTWKNAEGNLTLPSFRSCNIVVKKDASNNPVTEYYVGTSVGLYSAVNLGTTLAASGTPTWTREGGNVLNYAVITSLAYRPVDNVMVIGTHGNGMYYAFLGTPNYTPNLNTGVTTITNDRNFIRAVYPTISSKQSIQYTVGNMTGISRITVELLNLTGQVVWRKETSYQSGAIDVNKLAAGSYYLTIITSDQKYRHIQKIVKQ